MGMSLKYKLSSAIGNKLTAKLITQKCELLRMKFLLDEITSFELSQKVVSLVDTNISDYSIYYYLTKWAEVPNL